MQDIFDDTVECYYNREYDDSPGGVHAEGTMELPRFRGLQSQEISEVWWLVLWIDRLSQSDGQRSEQVKSTVKADYG